ncbi:PH domain-containing protein [Thalassiella azotivora]
MRDRPPKTAPHIGRSEVALTFGAFLCAVVGVVLVDLLFTGMDRFPVAVVAGVATACPVALGSIGFWCRQYLWTAVDTEGVRQVRRWGGSRLLPWDDVLDVTVDPAGGQRTVRLKMRDGRQVPLTGLSDGDHRRLRAVLAER